MQAEYYTTEHQDLSWLTIRLFACVFQIHVAQKINGFPGEGVKNEPFY